MAEKFIAQHRQIGSTAVFSLFFLGLESVVRILLLVSGFFGPAGLTGVPWAKMHVHNIGAIGHGLIVPVAFLQRGRLFRNQESEQNR